jgi:FHA domain
VSGLDACLDRRLVSTGGPAYRQLMPASAPPAPPQAQLSLPPDSDIVINHPTVSRHHAELRREDCGWSLSDLWSTNGTRVNGWRITSRCSVRQGDSVAFGEACFQLVD